MYGAQSSDSGLLGLLVATVALNYTLGRVKLPSLDKIFGREMGQFISSVLALLCVWVALGAIAQIPIIGDYVGWAWFPDFLARLSPQKPFLTLLGFMFSLIFIGGVTVAVHSRLRVNALFSGSETGRWAVALGSFYLSTLLLDTVRLCFDNQELSGSLWAMARTAASYVGVITISCVGDRYVRRQRVAFFRGYSVIQIAAFLVVGSILGDLLRHGSVHISPLHYAYLASQLLNSWAGLLATLLTFFLAAVLLVNLRSVNYQFRSSRPVGRAGQSLNAYSSRISMAFARCVLWSKNQWARGRQASSVSKSEDAWVTVQRLTIEAKKCFSTGDYPRSESLTRQAMTINRDRQKVPDQRTVGAGYLLMVQLLLRRGDVREAGRVAFEGYQRRKCSSTITALAKFYADQRSPLAERFERDAMMCLDKD